MGTECFCWNKLFYTVLNFFFVTGLLLRIEIYTENHQLN